MRGLVWPEPIVKEAVTLSVAKGLGEMQARFFASLRMTPFFRGLTNQHSATKVQQTFDCGVEQPGSSSGS